MVKRSKAHVIGEKAVDRIRASLPEEWAVRDKAVDYGVDLEVEIFEGEEPTGDIFLVQSKGSETGAFSVQIGVDTLRYLRSFLVPSFVFYVDIPTGEIYIKSINLLDLSEIKPDQKTLKLSFDDSDRLSDEKISAIENICRAYRGIRNHLPAGSVPIRLDNAENVVSKRYEVEISSIIRGTAGLKAYDSEADEYWLSVRFEPGRAVASYCDGTNFFFNVNLDEENPVDVFVALVTLSLAMLNRSDIADGAKRLVCARGINIPNPELMIPLVKFLAGNKAQLADFGIRIGVHKRMDPLGMVFIDQLRRNVTSADHPAIESFFQAAVESLGHEGDAAPVGEALFNLANVFQSHGKYRLALRHYISALRHQNKYQERPHFWQFLGTTFYDLRRYKCAAQSYRRAHELEPHPTRKLYLADALFLSGKFAEAKSSYAECKAELATYHGIWAALHEWVLEHLIAVYGDEYARDRSSAQAVWQATGEADTVAAASEILEKHDALDALAAFNTAGQRFWAEDYHTAVGLYLVSLATNPFDVSAWFNAIASAHCADDTILMAMISTVANGLLGSQLTEFFAEREANGEVPAGLTEAFAELQLQQDQMMADTKFENPASGIRVWLDEPITIMPDEA